MRAVSVPPLAEPERGSTRQQHHGQRALLVVVALLCMPALSFACKGGIAGKSPENPSAVLAVIGAAALGWKSMISRFRK